MSKKGNTKRNKGDKTNKKRKREEEKKKKKKNKRAKGRERGEGKRERGDIEDTIHSNLTQKVLRAQNT